MTSTVDALNALLSSGQTTTPTGGTDYSPLLGMAMGLLGSSGATRLPTTMGAALANGLGSAQQYQASALQNALNRNMLGYKSWLLHQMNQNQQSATPDQPQNSPQNPNPVAAQQAALGNALSSVMAGNNNAPSNPVAAALNASPTGGQYQNVGLLGGQPQTLTPQNYQQQPQPDNQQQGGLFPNMSPDMRALALSSMYSGQPGRVFSSMYQNDPNVVAAATQAKAENSLYNLRSNGLLADANGNIRLYNPKLGQGQILTNNGVQAAPNYLQTSIPMQVAEAQAANITAPGSVVQGPNGMEYPRTRAQQLNQPTTAQGVLNNYFGSSQLIPGQNQAQANTSQRIPISPGAPKPTEKLDDNGIPLPPPVIMPNTNGPISLGKPTLEALTENMKESGKSLNAAIHAGTDYQTQLGSLAEMQSSLSQMETGPGKAFNIGLQKVADGIASAVGMKNPYDFTDITNSQVLNKTTVLFSESVVGANNQNAQKALETIQSAVPNIHNTVAANDINAATLTATAAYKKAEADFAGRWSQSYNGVGYAPKVGSWDTQFQQKVPYMAFLLNNLSPTARAELMAYSRKNATLAYQIRQAQAAAPYLVKYGYIAPGGQ